MKCVSVRRARRTHLRTSWRLFGLHDVMYKRLSILTPFRGFRKVAITTHNAHASRVRISEQFLRSLYSDLAHASDIFGTCRAEKMHPFRTTGILPMREHCAL